MSKEDPNDTSSKPEVKQARPIVVRKVDLGELFHGKLKRMLEKIHPNMLHPVTLRADPDIVLYDQSLKPNRKGEFYPVEEKAIAEGRPETIWLDRLTKAIFHATENGIQDREGSAFRLVPPEIAITAHITGDVLTIEVKDNGQGMPAEVFSHLESGYDQRTSLKGKGRNGGLGLQRMYEEIEQIRGVVEIETKRVEDVGENSGTSVRFIFPVYTPS